MYEAIFSIDDAGPYAGPTARSDCRIELWCSDHADLLSLRGSDIRSALERIDATVGLERRLDGERETLAVTDSCLRAHETTIDTYLERHGCLLLPPIRYANGRKRCRVLAPESEALAGIYEALVSDGVDVDVRSKRTVQLPITPSPLSDLENVVPALTDRQRETIVTAVENGYYEIPRETTTDDLAGELGVARRTAEDHLRRAERKLLTSVVLRLFCR
ncbi:helix-turn-helix domain-containing protein [Natrarchaeobius sp. A-rgal3]|uniref:helix-turn-helix domain-containing protein n=1 Tax=Natrarchaeobius versutus TaxID=1679078 RepID=UPI00350ECA8A